MKKKKPKKQPKPKKKKPAAKKKPSAKKKKPAADKRQLTQDDIAAEFQEALHLAMSGSFFDAVQAFGQVARDDQGGEWADDALFNQGLCYLRMNLFDDAIASFSRVIQGYPDAMISTTTGGTEHGRTAAKALLGRIRCRLILGDRTSAQADLEDLRKYSDSYVIDNEGNRKTFIELAEETFNVATTTA